jgi:hypothetical protein
VHLTARREPTFGEAVPHGTPRDPFPGSTPTLSDPHLHPAPKRSRVSRAISTVQIVGSLLGVPLGLASGYTMYRANFAADTACQQLRSNIVLMLDKNVDAATRRMLVRRDIEAFERSCESVDPDAHAAFKQLLDTEPKTAAAAAAAKTAVKTSLAAPVTVARKTEGKTEAKTEAKPEIKPAAKPELKPEIKVEAKAEIKPETKSEPKTEIRVIRIENKPDAKPDVKPEPRLEARSEPKAETKAEPKAEPKVQPVAEAKAEPKIEPKVETKIEQKPEAVAAAETTQHEAAMSDTRWLESVRQALVSNPPEKTGTAVAATSKEATVKPLRPEGVPVNRAAEPVLPSSWTPPPPLPQPVNVVSPRASGLDGDRPVPPGLVPTVAPVQNAPAPDERSRLGKFIAEIPLVGSVYRRGEN